MKALLNKLNYLNINSILLIPFGLYIYNIHEIVFPKNYQQDDVRELHVSNFLDFSCVINQGDNHPLWTYLIWGFSKINFIEISYAISIVNICLLLGSVYFIFRFLIEKYDYSVAILLTTIFVSSPAVITYSVSLKQYMLELFYSSYCLYVSNSKDTLIYKFSSINFYLISILLVTGSLVNASIFIFLVIYYIFFVRINRSIFPYFAFSGLPILFFLNRILDKISRDSYSSYWNNFFLSSNDSIGVLNKISFISNMTFKSYFGFFYSDRLLFLLFFAILFSLFLNLKSNLFSKFIIFAFIIFNVLKLYPLGTGRTDIILFPFYLSLIAEIVFYIKTKLTSKSINLFSFIVLLIIFINSDPFYKQEQITPALIEIQNSSNANTAIVIASEQYPSFEYYGQKVFGLKIISKNNCRIKTPFLDNYFITGRKDADVLEFNNNFTEVIKFSQIFILGIELDSRGIFRDFEEAVLENGYVLINSVVFPDGIYLNSYEIKN